LRYFTPVTFRCRSRHARNEPADRRCVRRRPIPGGPFVMRREPITARVPKQKPRRLRVSGVALFRVGIGVYPGDPREARSKPMVGLSSFGDATTIVPVPCTDFDSVRCRRVTRPRYDVRLSPRSHPRSSCISLRQITGKNSASSSLNFARRCDARRARVREYANA
jgi:hypothetical protein